MALRTAKKTITRGDTNVLEFLAKDKAGVTINLSGATIRFTAKESYTDTDAEAKIQKTTPNGVTIVNASTGYIKVTLHTSDTSNLEPYIHMLVYDLQITKNGVVTTTHGGPLIVAPDATRTV